MTGEIIHFNVPPLLILIGMNYVSDLCFFVTKVSGALSPDAFLAHSHTDTHTHGETG